MFGSFAIKGEWSKHLLIAPLLVEASLNYVYTLRACYYLLLLSLAVLVYPFGCCVFADSRITMDLTSEKNTQLSSMLLTNFLYSFCH